jgi:deoxycytidylate deaminase
MEFQFTGIFEDLHVRLEKLSNLGSWSHPEPDLHQFRSLNGGVLNWIPSKGTISFEGSPEGRMELERLVAEGLNLAVASRSAHHDQSDLTKAPVEEVRVVSRVLPSARPEPSPPGDTATAESSDLVQSLSEALSDSELVIGLVAPLGTDLARVAEILKNRLLHFKYSVEIIRVSHDILKLLPVMPAIPESSNESVQVTAYITAGNEARRLTKANDILALGVARAIQVKRVAFHKGARAKRPRAAYIVRSLKHPSEVASLRRIYPHGFYLIGVDSDKTQRRNFLTDNMQLTEQQADELMNRDADEHLDYGQQTSDTFHLSDFFIRLDEDHLKLEKSVWRVLDILFGDPHKTPTFDEYAMFMAFAASLRSADLSRQVGAVVAKDKEIIATGANDCPRAHGGLYWPEPNQDTHAIEDVKSGRDYTRGRDPNEFQRKKMVQDVLNHLPPGVDKSEVQRALEESIMMDITEYGRIVHAEMEALLSCARNHVSSRGADLFSTTFPCHNCAKHIVAAGIKRVVYIEPYPKSKAYELHDDAISMGPDKSGRARVVFESFVGVGPRRFLDLFSMRLGAGYPLRRKNEGGNVTQWKPAEARLRIQMLPYSYVHVESVASIQFDEKINQLPRPTTGQIGETGPGETSIGSAATPPSVETSAEAETGKAETGKMKTGKPKAGKPKGGD